MVTSFTASEICAIIEACGKSKVTTFSGGGFTVKFAGVEAESLAPSPLAAESVPENLDRPAESRRELTEYETKEAERELKRQSELVTAARLANLMIEDPVEYEKLLANGELDDESNDEEA